MILECKYLGPFEPVIAPGASARELINVGDTVKLRLEPGVPLGGCWEIVKGKDEYEAGLKAAEDARLAAATAKADRAAKTLEAAEAAAKPVATKKAAKPEPDGKGEQS